MKVKPYCINKGQPGQYFGLIDAESGEVLNCAPNNWKTEAGAIRWAKDHGFSLETEEEKQERIFKAYKEQLADDTISPHIGGIRFNVIQYLCQFPNIDPVEMAASLRKDGHTILYDDTSISKKENMAHEAAVEKAFQRLLQQTSSELHAFEPELEDEEELEP